MPDWDRFRTHQLLSVPRRNDHDPAGPTSASRMFSPLVSAGWSLADVPAGAAVVSGWLRPPGTRQIQVLIGAQPSLSGVYPSLREPGHDAVPYPPGCVGRELPSGELHALLEEFPCWVRCPGQADQVREDGTPVRRMPGSFTLSASHLPDPFAWVVLAEPVVLVDVERQLLALTIEIPRLRRNENSEADRLALAGAEIRFRELTEARVSGLWTIHILVGGPTAASARASAGVLCSASELDDVPYVVFPGGQASDLHAAWSGPVGTDGASSPFLGGTALLSVLTAPPTSEVPGIRLLEPNSFDVTPEADVGRGVRLGTALDAAYEEAGPVRISHATLNRHSFICGATGSGKSQTTRWLLEQLSASEPRVPWLVLEPAKAEYARMAGRLTGRAPVLRIRPGDPDAVPASLNPLEPEPGFPLQSHLDLVRALFLAAFQADEPFPQVLSLALTQAYRAAGWDLVTGDPRPAHKPRFSTDDPPQRARPRYPKLEELQDVARRVVDQIGYGKEVTSNVKGFIDIRIGSLCSGTPGRFFQGGHPLDLPALLKANVVIELEGITDDQDKAFLMGALIIRIIEHLRVRHGASGADGLQHLMIIEEAHRLLRRVEHGPAAAAVELFTSLLAEIRAYGEGLVVVEQIPSKIVPDVIKNTALKVMHRLPSQEDRAAVGSTINLTDEQSRLVVSLPPGIAAVAVDGMDRPLLMQVQDGSEQENSDAAEQRPPLLGRRSKLCGQDCQHSACTLRQLNEAQHQASNSRVVVWVESVVVGYLCGFQSPVPTDAVRLSLNGLSFRSRTCALAYAVERALDARRPWLGRTVDPVDFAREVHSQLEHQLATGTAKAVPDFPRWQAGPDRYRDIRRAVSNSEEGRKPVTSQMLSQWRRRGLALDDLPPAEWADGIAQHSSREPVEVVLGDAVRSGLATALRDLVGDHSKPSVVRAVVLCVSGVSAEVIASQIFTRLETHDSAATGGI